MSVRETHKQKIARQQRMEQDRRLLKTAAHFAAAKAQAKEMSDPFVYARVFSRVVNGIGPEYSHHE